jgi:hypothetical protein
MTMLHAAKYDWQVFATCRNARYCNKTAWLANYWQRQMFEKSGDFAGMSQYATIMKSCDE